MKATLGIFWFFIAYLFRFMLTLLIEPQINPIKHFPVVTVSHKLLVPTIPHFATVLETLQLATGRDEAFIFATSITTCIPGIFGFLAWELKENWKLYQANLPASLRPVHFGSHGESIAQLLRPGFHSGTLPKAFDRLRNAHWINEGRRRIEEGMEFPVAVHKPLEAIDHVNESVRHFVERAFLALLNRHPAFAATPVELAELQLAPTRVQLHLAAPAIAGEQLSIDIEQINGWVVADVRSPGWLEHASADQKTIFNGALPGFYKMSAVDIVRGDIDRAFAGHTVQWALGGKQLIVRQTKPPFASSCYWTHERTMRPMPLDGVPMDSLPILQDRQVLLRAREISWAQWLDLWRSAEPDVHRPATLATRAAGSNQRVESGPPVRNRPVAGL